jgi:hypothetical protein
VITVFVACGNMRAEAPFQTYIKIIQRYSPKGPKNMGIQNI